MRSTKRKRSTLLPHVLWPLFTITVKDFKGMDIEEKALDELVTLV